MMKNTAKKAPLKAPKRRGRPKKGERLIGPAELEQINRLWLQSVPLRQIAERLGVAEGTVKGHINRHLKPRWERELRADLARDMAECEQIAAAAWASFERTGNVKNLELAKWAIEHRAKIAGHFSSAKLRVEQETEVRVAGLSPAELGEQTLLLIQRRAKEAREYEDRVRRLGLEGD